MKAIYHATYGSPGVLSSREVPVPQPGDHELLVRVHATTVNRTDCAILRGKPAIMRLMTGLFKPTNPITGTEFAGVIEETGARVTRFSAGDRIFGFDDQGLGSHAEYLTLPEKKAIAAIPERISYQEAAASLEGAHYAYNFINKIRLKPGMSVLVNGASGGIGSAAVQLLNNHEVDITAVCDTRNLERIKALGASRVIDYLHEDFTRDDRQYDYIFDTVGKSNFGKCKALLKPGGAYLSSELGPGAENLLLSMFPILTGPRKVIFPFPKEIQATADLIASLLEKNKYKPVIDRTWPLEDIAEAFRYVEKGQKTGNVVITVDHG